MASPWDHKDRNLTQVVIVNISVNVPTGVTVLLFSNQQATTGRLYCVLMSCVVLQDITGYDNQISETFSQWVA